MPQTNAGIVALTVAMPKTVRDNEYFQARYPEAWAKFEEQTLGRLFNNAEDANASTFDRAMMPYLNTPCRGAVQRRHAVDETSIDLEVRAAREALKLAGRVPADVDLLISTGFPPHHVGIGNAVHVAGALELQGAAFNLESACGGPLNALKTARAYVRSGDYKRVMVTASCTYSKFAPESDTMSWFMGDGAGAMLVEATEEGDGLLAVEAAHSADTCGTWFYDLNLDENGKPQIYMGASPITGKVMRGTAEPYLLRCSHGALERAGLSLSDIDFFVFHTPTAWFADFAADALGVPREKTVSTNAFYANCGPALTPANLHYAAATGRIKKGDHVLVFGPGSASSAAAAVMSWGDVAVGTLPEGVTASATP